MSDTIEDNADYESNVGIGENDNTDNVEEYDKEEGEDNVKSDLEIQEQSKNVLNKIDSETKKGNDTKKHDILLQELKRQRKELEDDGFSKDEIEEFLKEIALEHGLEYKGEDDIVEKEVITSQNDGVSEKTQELTPEQKELLELRKFKENLEYQYQQRQEQLEQDSYAKRQQMIDAARQQGFRDEVEAHLYNQTKNYEGNLYIDMYEKGYLRSDIENAAEGYLDNINKYAETGNREFLFEAQKYLQPKAISKISIEMNNRINNDEREYQKYLMTKTKTLYEQQPLNEDTKKFFYDEQGNFNKDNYDLVNQISQDLGYRVDPNAVINYIKIAQQKAVADIENKYKSRLEKLEQKKEIENTFSNNRVVNSNDSKKLSQSDIENMTPQQFDKWFNNLTEKEYNHYVNQGILDDYR